MIAISPRSEACCGAMDQMLANMSKGSPEARRNRFYAGFTGDGANEPLESYHSAFTGEGRYSSTYGADSSAPRLIMEIANMDIDNVDVELFRALIRQGQDPMKKRTSDDANAVHCLCEKALTTYRSEAELNPVKEVLRLLCGNSASRMLSEQNAFGQTPIHIAASNVHLLSELLELSRNSSINVADHRGQTVLHYVAGAPPPEMPLSEEQSEKFVKTLSHQHEMWQIENGHTWMGSGPATWNYDSMRLLLELNRGLKVNAVDLNGDTALHLAARAGNAVSAIILLHTETSLTLNVVNQAGFTPLLESAFWAELKGPGLIQVENTLKKERKAHRPLEARILIMLNLLSKGATTNCRDFDGETCADYVRRWTRTPETLALVDRDHLSELSQLMLDMKVFGEDSELQERSCGATPQGCVMQ